MLLEIIYIWNITMFIFWCSAYLPKRTRMHLNADYFKQYILLLLLGLALPLMGMLVEYMSDDLEKALSVEIFYYLLCGLFAYLSAAHFKVTQNILYNALLGIAAAVVAVQAIQLLPFSEKYLRYAPYAATYALFASLGYYLFKKESAKASS